MITWLGGRGERRAVCLFPVDDDAAWSCWRDADGTLHLATEPLERTLVILQVVLKRGEACTVVLAYPVLLLLGEHVFEHHARLDRHARQPFEAEPALIRVDVFGAHVTHDEDRLDTNSEFIGLVCYSVVRNQKSGKIRDGWLTVSGFVRENVATSQRYIT